MSARARDSVYHQLLVSHELGGAGLIALHLAATFQGQGYSSQVWIPGEGPAQCKATELGVPTHLYHARRVLSSGKAGAMFGNWQIGLRLRRQGPGVVHVHGPFHYGALHLGLRLSRLKRIVHVHLEEDEEGLRWAFRRPPELILTCAQFLVAYVRRTLPARYQER